MPNATERLRELMASGLEVYPEGMRGLAASPPRRPIPEKSGRRVAEWIKLTHPSLYAAAIRATSNQAYKGGLDGFGNYSHASTLGATDDAKAGTQPGALDRFLSTIQTLAPQYLQYRAQQDLLDVQLDRARQGLPPIRPTDYAPAVQLSVDPSMYSPALESLKPWLLYGALALGAYFLFLRRR